MGEASTLVWKCSSICLGAKAIRPPPTPFPSQHPPASLPRIPQRQPHKSTPCPGEPSPIILIKSSNPEVGWLWWGWVRYRRSLREEATSTHPLPARSITSMKNHPPWALFHGDSQSLPSRGMHPPVQPRREGMICFWPPPSLCSAWSNLLPTSLASVEVFRVSRA